MEALTLGVRRTEVAVLLADRQPCPVASILPQGCSATGRVPITTPDLIRPSAPTELQVGPEAQLPRRDVAGMDQTGAEAAQHGSHQPAPARALLSEKRSSSVDTSTPGGEREARHESAGGRGSRSSPRAGPPAARRARNTARGTPLIPIGVRHQDRPAAAGDPGPGCATAARRSKRRTARTARADAPRAHPRWAASRCTATSIEPEPGTGSNS